MVVMYEYITYEYVAEGTVLYVYTDITDTVVKYVYNVTYCKFFAQIYIIYQIKIYQTPVLY